MKWAILLHTEASVKHVMSNTVGIFGGIYIHIWGWGDACIFEGDSGNGSCSKLDTQFITWSPKIRCAKPDAKPALFLLVAQILDAQPVPPPLEDMPSTYLFGEVPTYLREMPV